MKGMKISDKHRFQLLIGGNDDEKADEEALKKEEALLAAGKGKGECQPTGCVVGVIRRKWRQYCGIIRKNEITEVRGSKNHQLELTNYFIKCVLSYSYSLFFVD